VAGYLRAGETYQEAAARKLFDELRLVTPLRSLGEVRMVDEGSHKFVGVFAGHTGEVPQFDPAEIAELVYIEAAPLDRMVKTTPDAFTPTFLHVYRNFRLALWRGL